MKPTSKKNEFIIKLQSANEVTEVKKYLPEYDPKEVAFNSSNVFKELQKETDKTLKVIGYKLVKEEYKEAVRELIKSNRHHDGEWWWQNFDKNLIKNGWNFKAHSYKNESDSIQFIINEAGVLDLWFEPVYEESTETKIMDYLAEQGIEINEECASEIIKIVNEK
jgi:hypothetical protein